MTASRWLAAFALIALGGAAGYVAYRTLDTRYRCHVATEVFGMVFCLAVIVFALQQQSPPRSLLFTRSILAMASAMLVFHAAYFVDKNVLGRRE